MEKTICSGGEGCELLHGTKVRVLTKALVKWGLPGLQMDKTITFAVCGLTRDSSRYIQNEILRIDNLFPFDVDRQWHVIESDSSDDTSAKLAFLAGQKHNFSYESLGNLGQKFPSRTERLAVCRNAYLDWLHTLERKPEFLLVVDLDGLNSRLTWPTILSSLSLSEDWTAIFANQEYYYDILALRCRAWNENDPFQQAESLEEIGFSRHEALRLAVTDKMVSIPRSANPISVESAFGGAAIYRVAKLSSEFRYSGLQDGVEVSEHVPFHTKMSEKGLNLYVVPNFYNADLTEHTKIKRPLRQLLHFMRGLIWSRR